MPDKYFTPTDLAETLVSLVQNKGIKAIADFAAGHGELLRAATRLWPECQVFANDIDVSCVRALRADSSRWTVSQCDFLNARSRLQSIQLRHALGKVCAIFLNPPFSGRGGTRTTVMCRGQHMQCSKAMAFVLNSLPYLRKEGELIAILPASAMTNEKDRQARDYLASTFEFKVVQHCNRKTFSGCAAQTVITYLSNRPAKPVVVRNIENERRSKSWIDISIVRGCIPLHEAENGLAGSGFAFVHSTDVRGAEIDAIPRSVRQQPRTAVGPCVLISRVGNPVSKKCALYLNKSRIVLSDCVIALECGSCEEAAAVQRRLVSNWTMLAAKYNGTCAPYITMRGLEEVLPLYRLRIQSKSWRRT
ncbi:MAG: hypothetical protein ACKV2Q_15265 [Planctomycetaceae bacterium]